MVVVKGNIKEITESGVVFEDESIEEVDTVIFATGYKFHFPFLQDSVVKVYLCLSEKHDKLLDCAKGMVGWQP